MELVIFVLAVTKSGKSIDSFVRGWMPKPSNYPHIVEYAANFTVPHDFGLPGAVLITNFYGKEFFLREIDLALFLHLLKSLHQMLVKVG